MIKANAHKYSVSAMCRVLQVNRRSYYYEAKQKPDEPELASETTQNQKVDACRETGIQTPDRTEHEAGRARFQLHNSAVQTAKGYLQRTKDRKCPEPPVPEQRIQGCCDKRFNVCKGRYTLELHMCTCWPL